jgi:hypothetical protein
MLKTLYSLLWTLYIVLNRFCILKTLMKLNPLAEHDVQKTSVHYCAVHTLMIQRHLELINSTTLPTKINFLKFLTTQFVVR